MSGNKCRTSDKLISENAKARKQADVEYTNELRQTLRDLGIHDPIISLEELTSKPLEEYEKSVKKYGESIKKRIIAHLEEGGITDAVFLEPTDN